jgi:hypothetical protein
MLEALAGQLRVDDGRLFPNPRNGRVADNSPKTSFLRFPEPL